MAARRRVAEGFAPWPSPALLRPQGVPARGSRSLLACSRQQPGHSLGEATGCASEKVPVNLIFLPKLFFSTKISPVLTSFSVF